MWLGSGMREVEGVGGGVSMPNFSPKPSLLGYFEIISKEFAFVCDICVYECWSKYFDCA